jgi:choline dehydrogenase
MSYCPVVGQVPKDKFVASSGATNGSFQNLSACNACIGELSVDTINGMPVPPEPETFDYIIVGAGTAGSILADRLSAWNENSVLVIEGGRNNELDPTFNLDADIANAATGAVFGNWNQAGTFVDEIAQPPDPSLLNFREIGESGKGWGGAGSHNFMQAVRPSPDFISFHGATVGDPFWGASSMSAFAEIETFLPCDTCTPAATRGTSGPISVLQLNDPPVTVPPNFVQEVGAAVVATPPAGDAGIAIVPDYNNNVNNGVSLTNQFTASNPGGNRVSGPMVRSFGGNDIIGTIINDSSRRLTVISNAYVDRVVFDGTTAIGVLTIDEGEKEIQYNARQKVILCAGAFRSPGILERSGIGSSSVLSNYDIPVLVDNPAVGENMQNHPVIQAQSVIPADRNIFQGFNRSGQFSPMALLNLTAGSPFRTFIYAMIPGRFGGLNSRNVLLNQTIPVPPITGGPGPQPIFVGGFLVRNNGRGSIHVSSKSHGYIPSLDYNAFSFSGPPDDIGPTPLATDPDAILLNAAYVYMNTLFTSLGGAYSLLWPNVADFSPLPSLELVNAARSVISLTGHWAGTCRMSNTSAAVTGNPTDGVVDTTLHVHGVQNLMVADNSVWNIIPDANTAIPAYYIGVQAARLLGA